MSNSSKNSKLITRSNIAKTKVSSSISIFDELVISNGEIEDMSATLVRKFGAQAMNMAAFFLDEHLDLDDQERAESWLRVMACLDQTHNQSLTESMMN